jgi:hypothetical protein
MLAMSDAAPPRSADLPDDPATLKSLVREQGGYRLPGVSARTGPSRSGVPTDPDQPFQSIPISVWRVWRGVTAPVSTPEQNCIGGPVQ